MKTGQLLFFIFLLLASCDQKGAINGEIVATVGSSTLTREEIQQVMPPGLIADDSIVWVRSYLESWVEQEVLFQFAEKKGLGTSAENARTFQDIRKRYVVGLLTDSIATAENINPAESELVEYYKSSPDEWVAGEPLYRVCYFFVSESYDAKVAQSEFKSMKDWMAISKKYGLSTETMTDTLGVILTTDQLAMLFKGTQPVYLSPLKWTVTGIKTNDDKSVVLMLRVLDMVKKGDKLPFRLAYEDIKTRLLVKKRQEKIQELTDSLRKNGNVQINF